MRSVRGWITKQSSSRHSWIAALISGGIAFVVYAVSLARGVTFWDAGEFLAAVHSLGIPHPPGTPLYILLARVWSFVIAPITGFTIAVNLFSALCTSVAIGLFAGLFERWTGDRVASIAAALCAGFTATIWLNATETEVYSAALVFALIILWTANRAAETHEPKWILVTAYVCGLGWAVHLSSLLSIPAVLYLIWLAQSEWNSPGWGSARARAQLICCAAVLVLVGASAVLFMIVRAPHDPAINQGNPATWSALVDVIQRAQYDVAGLWPRRAPVWIQLGNLVEYADWQFAQDLAPDPPPSLPRTMITICYLALGVYGCVKHRVADRRSWRALMILFVTTSVGVVAYLNLRAGPSFGIGVLAPGVLHEARERDYFFVLAFACWALWAGYGAVVAGRRYGRAIPAALLVVGIPLICNWSVIRHARVDEQRAASTYARAVLSAAPPDAVLLSIGDNDTYPLWYMQQVHTLRTDVTVVTLPLLGPKWYRAELARRYELLSAPFVNEWRGLPGTEAEVRRRAAALGRPVLLTSTLGYPRDRLRQAQSR